MTVSRTIGSQLKKAIKRKDMSQVQLSVQINRSASTVNSYLQNQPTPIEAIQDIAEVLNDSMLNQNLSNEFFGTLPAMETIVYQDNPHVLDFLQQQEANERKTKKEVALRSLSKNDHCLTREDLDIIKSYANEYLDEMLLETRLVMSMLAKTDLSIMQAVSNRKSYWKMQGYLGEERN
ncbi:helix-turn-helix domain-containing protein [Carnobacterium pleistocenium]|uniref:helix-turn-helix domain-containing protein n=1 Tax=Carnobacterium pleistocenium TaxID=181073 RepID=UPI00054E705E|nr:helix-turn-helix transcriptional regulator [Carnobacterium pleistocenium]